MTLKYYFAAAVLAASALVAGVYLGWVESSVATLTSAAVPLFLLGASAAWFLDALDLRLSDLSRTAERLAGGRASTEPPRSGDAVSLIARSLDGVQQRVAELQVRIDQQRVIAEHAPDAMWVFHVESGRLVDANQKFADLSGFAREQLIGMSPLDLGPPTQADGTPTEAYVREIIDRVLEGERVVQGWTLCRRQGGTVSCELRAIKLPSLPDRTLIGGTLIDISERLRSEQELAYRLSFEALISRLSTEMISLQSDAIDEGIQHALGEIGRFAKADRSYVAQFDPSGERVSRSHEWCAPGVQPQYPRLQNQPAKAFSWVMPRLQCGEIVHVPRVSELPPEAAAECAEWEAESIVSLLLVPMRPSPSVPGCVGFDWVRAEKRWAPEFIFLLTIFSEMVSNLLGRQRIDHELMRQRDALERSNSELTRSNSELQRFAYAASHDLQEPLRAISGFSDLLATRYRGQLDDTADEYLDFMRDAVTRMRSMIANLLEYSRIDASPQPFSRCDLNSLLGLALSNLHASIDKLQAQVRFDSLPVVMGDASQLLQLLQNLIGNAIKFHGDGAPEVRVGAKCRDGEWTISVRDNGSGLDPADAGGIFDVFSWLHPPDRHPGSGIGLWVCKRIIERHGGRIWAEPNRDGPGTTFHFTLPAIPAQAAAETAESAA